MDVEEGGVAYSDDAFLKASGPLGTTMELRKNSADGRQAVTDEANQERMTQFMCLDVVSQTVLSLCAG